MTEEKWQDAIATIKDNFEVTNHNTQDLPEDMGPGRVEIIEFIGPLGNMKLEFTTQPLVIDKRTIGSRRIGSDVKVEYKYSDTENVHKFKAFKFNEAANDWEEMEVERSGNMFF